MSASNKISLCSHHSQSHLLQVSKTSVILLEILPFLTQSQRAVGETQDWFSRSHLKELLELLYQNDIKGYSSYPGAKYDKKLPSRFIVTGTTLRAACVFKNRSEDDVCLISKVTKGPGRKIKKFNNLADKLIIHVCPKTNSSIMNVSQLFHSGDDADSESISKYFQSTVTT